MLKYYTSLLCSFLAAGLLVTSASLAVAQTQLEKPTYLALTPSFVTNYGNDGRLHYLKVDISVRVESIPDSQTVDNHTPQIRNELILLLSQQTSDGVNTHEGRQKLRADALQAVQEILVAEEGRKMVTDLLFDNFIVQS
ncbi:MAG: flagellar basal body-associated FliL family protein [Pseudomonadales bacterium]